MWLRYGLALLLAGVVSSAELEIVAPCEPAKPWTVAGERGALFGRQNGVFEAWQWPVKLISNFRIRAELADYAVPIDVNRLAAQIRVTPAETTITYSHAAFTIRQHMFATRGEGQVGAAVFFEIASARALDLTFSFTPEMIAMWPAPSHGRSNGEWVKQGESGYYILHTDDPDFSGFVAMPKTQPGILVPYQEHPQTYPLELKLHFDPKEDQFTTFPLTIGLWHGAPYTLDEKAARSLLDAAQGYYAHFFERRLMAETPDPRVNDALRWAEVAIDQGQVRHGNETGLVAGYYESADSARPGYAWFFGRDTLWTSYAINSYGDFALTRRALDFLFARQRGDGKIMHEYSQSAEALDWTKTPYFYASADSTPLLVMAMADYLRTSGDLAYVKQHWEAIRKAYSFTRAHTGNDAIYSNAEGTGWVESWPQGMPKEEIYLAAVDQQSSTAMSYMAEALGDQELARSAKQKAREIANKIEGEFYSREDDLYAFSRNPDGSLDRTQSIYPAVAWWDGTFALKSAEPMLSRWASPDVSADWGTRDISDRTPFYDPISYHQGSIWPLFTGWVSLAEYRAGRALSGYAHLMQNVNLTWAQDLGAVTELLSGEFYQPLGRSSSHQTWSSAMVITPMLRGLFGLEWDGANHKLLLAPHLPADWDHAVLRNVPLGDKQIDLEYRREADHILVFASRAEVCLVPQSAPSSPCTQKLSIPVPPVEIAIPAALPNPGDQTKQLKVIDERYTEHEARFVFASSWPLGYDLKVRLNRQHVTVDGASLQGGILHVRFPNGPGYEQQNVTFHF
ncbi:MAG TPA: hypothetical protein VKX25_12430 [Bryobacteraceae bacterium]|jgi:hypothetical protein|nr:hypothetical protein [Bryobacteraceae bacterium]